MDIQDRTEMDLTPAMLSSAMDLLPCVQTGANLGKESAWKQAFYQYPPVFTYPALSRRMSEQYCCGFAKKMYLPLICMIALIRTNRFCSYLPTI
jgi:exoribonuclease II